jgi:serine/threonine protein kinase
VLVQPLASDDPAEIGGYRLRARLGAGGMGRVYLASTPAGRSVALKVVRPELSDDQDFRARFRQEIQAARQVHGLYTAQLLDADPAATPPWLVTAYVPGPSLQEAVAANGPMPEAMVFRLIAGVAEALQAIHAAGVVHRDLKPSNVLLAPDGPRVIDFGIARALEATALTRSGMMVGSPQFMAPEQILDQPVTPAIDVFALGSLAAYAARGRPAFGEGHSAAVSYRVLHQPPDLDGCPPQVRVLIEPCLRKEAGARPAPAQILEFCLAHTAGTADPSWAPASPAPGWSPQSPAPDWSPPSPGQATTAMPQPPAPQPPAPVFPWGMAPGEPAGPAPTDVVTGHPARPSSAAATTAARRPPPPGTGRPGMGRPGTAGPGGASPGTVEPGRLIPPRSMINAVKLMYVGAALAATSIVAALATTPALKVAIRQQHPFATQGELGAFTSGTLAFTIAGALISIGLWLAVARRTRRGRPGVRVMSMILFGLDCLTVAKTYAHGLLTGPTWILGAAEWGVGLTVILFLWDRRSTAYLEQQRRARSLATPQWRTAPGARRPG